MAIAFSYDESDNKVVVTGGTSGTPATFANFATADRRPELCPDPTCATDFFDTKGTGWAHDAGNDEYDSDASQAADSDLTEGTICTSGLRYRVQFEVKNYIAGNICPVCGTQEGIDRAADGVYVEYVTANGTNFIIRADLDFDGSITGIYIEEEGAELTPEGAPVSGAKDLELTYAIRSVEDLALKLDLIVAAKTTETDYIFLTGTDWKDDAQTESIDVSAGNGVYVTTKYFRSIDTDGIDCEDAGDGTGTAWADGTLEIRQRSWGVIWDYGNDIQYQIDAWFDIGDGSTATHFKSIRQHIYFNDVCQQQKLASIFYVGTKIDATKTADGSVFHYTDTMPNTYMNFYGTAYFYGLNMVMTPRGGGDLSTPVFYSLDASEFINCFIQGFYLVSFDGTDPTITNLRVKTRERLSFYGSSPTINGLVSYSSSFPIELVFGPITLTGINLSNAGTSDFRVNWLATDDAILINRLAGDITDVTWAGTNTKSIYDKYTIDIHIADKDGANLSGVVVDCENTNGTAVWAAGTIITAADGAITQQTATYIRVWYDAGTQSETLSPHKFTLSKAGYETLVKEAITVDGKIVWDLEMQPIRSRALGRGSRRMQVSNFE